MTAPHLGSRIVIVGSAGSGKTTLAAELAERLDIKHIELDALHWGPNWQPPSIDDFRQNIKQAISSDRWIADGNYSAVRDILWDQADSIIWLDLPLPLLIMRLFKRGLRRSLLQEPLWNNNRETLYGQFFAKDSLLRYTLARHRSRKKELPTLFAQYPHLTIHLPTNPGQVKQFLNAHTAKDNS